MARRWRFVVERVSNFERAMKHVETGRVLEVCSLAETQREVFRLCYVATAIYARTPKQQRGRTWSFRRVLSEG